VFWSERCSLESTHDSEPKCMRQVFLCLFRIFSKTKLVLIWSIYTLLDAISSTTYINNVSRYLPTVRIFLNPCHVQILRCWMVHICIIDAFRCCSWFYSTIYKNCRDIFATSSLPVRSQPPLQELKRDIATEKTDSLRHVNLISRNFLKTPWICVYPILTHLISFFSCWISIHCQDHQVLIGIDRCEL
jgi:hypothetical protein